MSEKNIGDNEGIENTKEGKNNDSKDKKNVSNRMKHLDLTI